MFQLNLKVVQRIEAQEIVKAFLIVAVAAFNLAIVPGSPGTDQLVCNVQLCTEEIKGMSSIGF